MLEQLKKVVLKKFGEELCYTKDCEALADMVCQSTGGRISATTIRRLYGFLKSSSAPSRFTLDVLAQYIGFKYWSDFQSNYICEGQAQNNLANNWLDFQERALELSAETYNLIKSQSGIPFKSVVSRIMAENRIANFLESDKMALSFVAPGGSGKSTMLAKWFENHYKDVVSKDVVLFFNASFMINCLNSDFMLERWIEEQLNTKGYLKYFLEKPKACEGNIILVLDALDEVSYDNAKLERLFLQLNQFIANRKDSGNMKLILTSRTSTWEKFAIPFIKRDNSLLDAWYEIDLDLEQIDKRNLPVLNSQEIQYVFDETINQHFFYELKVEGLDYYHRHTLSNPFFLELFVKIYTPHKVCDIKDGFKLIDKFLKNKIYYSRYSDEKIDLLRGILQLQDYGKVSTSVKKMDLKSMFPIHLKTAGNYYYAYEEILSYGLITEYVSINEYNGYCKFVKIYNEQLFEVLLVKELIGKNGGINFDLFKQIETDYKDLELKNRLIAQLFSTAIEAENYEALSQFFELSEATLTSSYVSDTLISVISNMDDKKIDLIKIYASETRSVEFMFALSGNLNRLNGDFRKVVEIISEANEDTTTRIKSLSLLLMTSLMSLEQELADKYYKQLMEIEPNSTCSTYSIALRFTSILFYKHITGKSNDIELLRVFYYRQMAYSQVGDTCESWSGEFEVLVCNALLYMKSYHKVIQMIEDAELFYDQLNVKGHFSNYKILRSYKLIAQNMLGMKLSDKQMEELEFCNDSLISAQEYPLQIFFKSLLAGIYFDTENRKLQEKHSNRAFKISEFAKYDFCKVGLLTNMARYYHVWDEQIKENLCLNERDEIVKARKAEIMVEVLLCNKK